MRMGRIVDLSHKLYPGKEEYGLEIETFYVQDLYPQYRVRPEDNYVITKVHITPHVGTHIEAPSHYIKGGMDVSELPLELLVGEAIVMDFTSKDKGEAITLKDIQAYHSRLRPKDIVILKTGRSVHYRTERAHDRPYLTNEAVKWLVEHGISCLGTDASGIEPPGVDYQINHFTLLSSNIPIIEFMNNLDQLRFDRILLFVLPWNIVGSEASPVRVIAIEPTN
jgi:arylformamidase